MRQLFETTGLRLTAAVLAVAGVTSFAGAGSGQLDLKEIVASSAVIVEGTVIDVRQVPGAAQGSAIDVAVIGVTRVWKGEQDLAEIQIFPADVATPAAGGSGQTPDHPCAVWLLRPLANTADVFVMGSPQQCVAAEDTETIASIKRALGR